MIEVLYDGLGYLFKDFDSVSHIERHFGLYLLSEDDEIRLFAFGEIELDFIVSKDREILAPVDKYGNITRIKIKPQKTVFKHEKSGNRLRILSMNNNELVEAGERFRAMDNQIKPNNLIVLNAPKKPKVIEEPELAPPVQTESETVSNEETLQTSKYEERNRDFMAWLESENPPLVKMTKSQIQDRLIERNRQLWASGFKDWWEQQTIYKAPRGRKKFTPDLN